MPMVKRLPSEHSFSQNSGGNTTTRSVSGSSSSSRAVTANRWTYSKPRQLALWVKQSVQKVVQPPQDFQSWNLNHPSTSERNHGHMTWKQSSPINGPSSSVPEDPYEEHDPYTMPESDENGFSSSCLNIDQAMNSLHQLNKTNSTTTLEEEDCQNNDLSNYPYYHLNLSNQDFEYDWILDGELPNHRHHYAHKDLTEQDGIIPSSSTLPGLLSLDRKRSISGDEALDLALAGMELEISSQEISNSYSLEKIQQSREPAMLLKKENCDKKDDFEYPHTVIDVIHPPFDAVSQASDLSDTDMNIPMNSSMMAIRTPNSFVVDDYKKYIVPDFLPFQDPSTPEGAFFRRIQIEQDASYQYHSHVSSCFGIQGLSKDYFLQVSDPLLSILLNAPWDDITLLESTNQGYEMERYLLEKLSLLDVASKDLQARYLIEIQNKDNDIAHAIDIIHATHWDISTALSYTSQLTTYIHQIQGNEQYKGGIYGSESILIQATERETFQYLDDLLCDVQEFFATESSIFDFCDSFTSNPLKYTDGILPLLDRCQAMKGRLLCDTRFQRLTCLDDSRSRISHIFGYICKKMDEEVLTTIFQKCKDLNMDTDPWNEHHLSEYNALFEARMTILEFQTQANHERKDSPFYETKDDSDWSECIFEGLAFEADRCLAKALLNPTNLPTDIDEHSDFHDNIEKMKDELNDILIFQENAPSLRKIVKNLISIRFEFDPQKQSMPKIFHSLCVNLAAVMHSYFRIMGWHRVLSKSFLNRCEPDLLHSDSTLNVSNHTFPTSLENMEVTNRDIHKNSTSPLNDSKLSPCVASVDRIHTEKLSSHLPSDLDFISCKFPDIASEVYNYLSMSRSKFWTVCRVVIRKFLEAVLDAERYVDATESSSKWSQELQSFHCIYTLCKQMDVFAKEFIGVQDDSFVSLINPDISDSSNEDSNVFPALRKLFEAFVRKAHVDSMTEIGTMMSSEEWNLLPLHFTSISASDKCTKQDFHSYLQNVVLLQRRDSLESSLDYLYRNHFILERPHGVLILSICVNPFSPIVTKVDKMNDDNPIEFECTDDCQNLYEQLSSYITVHESSSELMLGTNALLYGLLRWTVRLMEVQNKLPPVIDQVSSILCNVYDLYFLTIFRLCCGSSISESILLGASRRSDSVFNERFPIDLHPNKKQAKSVGIVYSSSRRESFLISNHCNEDINAPLPHEQSDISTLRTFITRGQKDLCHMVKFDQVEQWPFVGSKGDKIESFEYVGAALIKRLAAASSCLLATCILDIFMTDLPDSDKGGSLRNYHANLLEVILPMQTLMFRIAATRAIFGRNVVMNILSIGDGWSDRKLNNHSNAYIDSLSDHLIQVWQMLASSPFRKIPKFVHKAWEHVIEVGFRSLLEGFSKIYDCSTEGRALMSIDLATFASNMSKRNLDDHANSKCIPAVTVSPRYGMQYVDLYVKVYYFPEDDVLTWIQDNLCEYHLSHLLTLVSFGSHNQMSQTDIQRVVQKRRRVQSLLLKR